MIPDEVRAALVAHAEEEAPNEACGLVAFRDGVAERYLPAENEAASPYRFELKPADPLDFFLEDEGYELGVFHSHLSSPPRLRRSRSPRSARPRRRSSSARWGRASRSR